MLASSAPSRSDRTCSNGVCVEPARRLCRARSTASTAPTLLPLLRSPQAAARRRLLLELRGLAQSRFEPLHAAFLRNTIERAAELLEVRRQGLAAEAARLEQGD